MESPKRRRLEEARPRRGAGRTRGGRRSPSGVKLVGEVPAGTRPHLLRRLVSETLRLLDAEGTVVVRFASDRTLRRLNRAYRGIDRATDVLSFPGGEALPGATRHLGDLLISSRRARVQARAASLPLAREVEELVLHGVLHLAGYDHETDGGEMDRLEVELRERLLAGEGGGSRARRGGPPPC